MWSNQQTAALDKVADWLSNKGKPFFYLAGYAGTGKTTLAKHFADSLDGPVFYGAFTGKAASVMRSKGCSNATTIHRLIYESRSKSSARLRELKLSLESAEPEDRSFIEKEIEEEIEAMKAPNFALKEHSDVRAASLIVIDECSMISGRMADDLLSFGVPILVLGDPAQLPPVMGEGYFTSQDPDVMLTEVHRQARESGILRLATDIREGRSIDYCNLGDAEVIRRCDVVPADVVEYDQIIVGRNKTRHATNMRVRQLKGIESRDPVDGDRLMCLRNNHKLGLLNGEIYSCSGDSKILDQHTLQMFVDDGVSLESIESWRAPFYGEKLGHWDSSGDIQEFTYGYVMTAHKSQGSQFDSVIVFDESNYFRADATKWLYTACTRAAKKLTVVR